MKFLEKAEALAKTLEEKGDTENAEVVKKLLSEVRSIIEACPVPADIKRKIHEAFFASMQTTKQTIYEYRTGANIAKCAHGIVKQVGAEIAHATQQKAA